MFIGSKDEMPVCKHVSIPEEISRIISPNVAKDTVSMAELEVA